MTSVHDDNDPRRQLLTTTTAYNDNDPPRQRPTTTMYATAAGGSDSAAGIIGSIASVYEVLVSDKYSFCLNEYEYSHSRVLAAQTGTRAASTSINPKNLASTRADEYSYRRCHSLTSLLANGPPPPVLAQEVPQPLVARPRIPAPGAAFVHQHPGFFVSPSLKVTAHPLSLPRAICKMPLENARIIAPVVVVDGINLARSRSRSALSDLGRGIPRDKSNNLTIPGIYYVIDPGFAKQNAYDPRLVFACIKDLLSFDFMDPSQ
ncbi:hypothetical protein EDB89DRAFT_2073131 [Lactarius sanguifluus]|nr:hypothetical protein EDB89DRAFT_2073131 [Lactarius sanguifluus]